MPLKILREEILKKTASQKYPQSETVSRTFYVLTSPSMNHLKDWFHKWFPVPDEDLKKIYPWITIEASSDLPANLSEIISQSWLEAFSAGTANNLTSNGFRIMDTANQIILERKVELR